MGKILGIDHGSVRIGIAVSDDSHTISFGREVIANNKNAKERIKKIILEDDIIIAVIGYPLNLKGEKTPQTLEVEKFEEELIEFLEAPPFENIEVVRWDERFTSKMAADSMIESGMKKKNRQIKGNLDIISASLMLQSYLDN
ncbi:MAG: Holliday junction resolvase RuvX, partial [Ignavibacteria bacterium]